MRVSQVVIVNGYGCNLDSPLRPYLDSVAAFLLREPSLVIFSGGRTQQKSFPEMSEAAVMAGYVTSRVPELVFELEDNSYTEYDNIRNAADRVRARRWEPDRIVVFCEATRALKVAMLARHFIGFPPACGKPPIRVMTDSWELMNPFWEMCATVQAWLSIRFQFLNTLLRWQRIRKSKTR